MSMQKIRLNICGIEFTINTEKTEAEALEAAAAVDFAIRSLNTNNNRVSTTLASIITALDFYDKMQESIKSSEYANALISGYKYETEQMRIENERMKEELRMVRSQLKNQHANQETHTAPDQQFKFTTTKSSGKYIRPTLDDIVSDNENYQNFFEQNSSKDVENN